EDIENLEVVWNQTGDKQVELWLQASGIGFTGDSVRCDTTLYYCVRVYEKYLGFFVDQDVPYENGHDGRSWETAFPTLQQALALASQGDYIWVAEGAYSPRDSFPANMDYAQVSTAGYMCDYDSVTVFTPSYVMDWDSVQVFGGFAGTEDNLSERNMTEHPTILRGGDASVIIMDGGTAYTNGLTGLTRGARWDGVTVREGVAVQGGGVLFRNGATGVFANAIIKQNEAYGAGGGVYIDGPYTGPGQDDEPAFYQVEISGNRAGSGAGIYNNGSSLMLVNATVAGNSATRAGGGLYNASGNPQVLNTIIWSNVSGNGRDNDVTNAGGVPYWSHCDIGGAIVNKVWNAAYGTDGGQNVSVNPYFVSTGDPAWPEGNYRLQTPSLVMEGGRNLYVIFGEPRSIVLSSPAYVQYNGLAIPHDLANQPRILYDLVDMGAYEYARTVPAKPVITRRIEIPEVEGVYTRPPAGMHYVESRRDFTFTVIPADGYTLENIRISSGSELTDREKTTLIPQADGSLTVTFHEVNEPLHVTVENVVQVTTGSGGVDRAFVLWAGGDRLHVQASEPAELQVYTTAGRLYDRRTVAAGRTEIPLPKGLYIVTLNGDGVRHKIVIR
ncbi:MAG: T9SS type A sorting domain-containing protein, partial [Tannerella sp.]|nr:T9SS type A sorting domain-containing protein [Tannerella sp.]